MPRRLPPMPDSPREGVAMVGPCPQCGAEGVLSSPCLKPNLHQPVFRFWDRFNPDDAPPSTTAAPRHPRGPPLQPLDGTGNALTPRAPPPPPLGRSTAAEVIAQDEWEDSEDGQSLPEPEPLSPTRKCNVLPPLPPLVELAVMRKLYMAGMTVSPRSRQIRPLPQVGETEVPECWAAGSGGREAADDDDDLPPPAAYDPALLDEALVRELSLDDLLRPEVAPRPARMRLDPISGARPLRPTEDVFCHRHKAKHIVAMVPEITEEE